MLRLLGTGSLLFALMLTSAGCAGSSDYMTKARSAAPLAAPADRAMVVFVRPSGMAFAINFSIVDQNGRWLGDAVSQSHFAVALPPGEYTFVGWAENTDLVKATVAAGRIYYVEVSPALGALYSQVSLEALTPRSSDWSELPHWLEGTTRLEPLPTGAAYMDQRHADAMKRVASANENWSDMSPDDRAQRTLREADGVPGTELPVASSK
ncbi:MAG TPA: hypothetical protein VF765_16195 [Polyangiaceae bacterium]